MGPVKLRKLVTAPREAMSEQVGAGQPLPPTLRHQWESTMGQDLANVRVHEGHQAALVGADAFTSGQDIFVRAGKYQPLEQKGQSLIAHEVAHVVQQGGADKIRVPEGMVEVSSGPSEEPSNE